MASSQMTNTRFHCSSMGPKMSYSYRPLFKMHSVCHHIQAWSVLSINNVLKVLNEDVMWRGFCEKDLKHK